MRKIYLLLSTATLVTILSVTTVRAQDTEVGGLIKSNPADATKLAAAYLTPLFKGFGTGLTQGWYNTARPKGFGRFDIRVSASAAIVPASAKTFDVSKLNLSDNIVVTSASSIAPTVAGKEVAGPTLSVRDDDGNEIESFELPQGTGIGYIPAPQLQATVGLPKGIDVSLRYVPDVKIGDEAGEVGMVGGGVRVDLLQFLSKAGKVMPFNLAVAVGYTRINYTLGLDVERPDATEAQPKTPSDATKDISTQRLSAQFSGMNYDVILSKRLLLFTPYVSVGFSNAKTDVGLLGNFPIITGALVTPGPGPEPVVTPTYETFTDPIRINRTEISGMRASAGFQLSLTILKIYASYNLGEYKSFNAGIGLGF